MTDTILTSGATEPPIGSTRTLWAGLALLALIVAGDLLMWRQASGVNSLVFMVAVIFAIAALHPRQLGESRTVLLLLVALLGVMPMFETESLWALLTATGGITLLALGISNNLPKFEDWATAFARFNLLAPLRLAGDGIRLIAEGGQRGTRGGMLRLAAGWLVPVSFALVFVVLFAAANPVIEYGLRAIQFDRLLELIEPGRVLLWGFVAFVCWPVLVPRLLSWTPIPQWQGPIQPRAESLVFGSRAILNSLLVFNVLFAAQTVLDLVYLWGGVRLPEAMGHAEYAHRGAYPLIVTALLAAAFVLVAMRPGGAGEKSPLIRGLVYLWIAQNVWLVISSVLRLKLYVEVYYLSELRIAAFIWMGLVAVGLVLIVARIVLRRSNRWLVMCNLVALSVTLWTVSWVDMQSLIASYNVRHAYEVTGRGVPIDQYYLSEIGPAAIPALDEFLLTARHAGPSTQARFSLMREELAGRLVARDWIARTAQRLPQSWHGWSWREERLTQYLIEHPFAPESVQAIE